MTSSFHPKCFWLGVKFTGIPVFCLLWPKKEDAYPDLFWDKKAHVKMPKPTMHIISKISANDLIYYKGPFSPFLCSTLF